MHINIKLIHRTFTLGLSLWDFLGLLDMQNVLNTSHFNSVLNWGILMTGFSLHISQCVSPLRRGQKFLLKCGQKTCVFSLLELNPVCRPFPSHLQRQYELRTIEITQASLNFFIIHVENEIIASYQYLSHFSSPLAFLLSQKINFSLR